MLFFLPNSPLFGTVVEEWSIKWHRTQADNEKADSDKRTPRYSPCALDSYIMCSAKKKENIYIYRHHHVSSKWHHVKCRLNGFVFVPSATMFFMI